MLTVLTSIVFNVSAANILADAELPSMPTELFSPLELRSSLVLRNRIAKAAMEEGMAGEAQLPDERLVGLYRRWGTGGAGC
jgi:2,4-dienoyl-CoA reductase-like NADH-dependent reductase (Old Yellow Enzyme family)